MNTKNTEYYESGKIKKEEVMREGKQTGVILYDEKGKIINKGPVLNK